MPDAPIPMTFPAEVGDLVVTLIHYDGTSYIDSTGSVYASPTPESAPNLDDASAAVADPQLPPQPAPTRKLSKLTLKRRLDELGKWDTFKAVAAQAGIWDDFVMAQEISTDDATFTTHLDSLRIALDLTEEQLIDLLS